MGAFALPLGTGILLPVRRSIYSFPPLPPLIRFGLSFFFSESLGQCPIIVPKETSCSQPVETLTNRIGTVSRIGLASR